MEKSNTKKNKDNISRSLMKIDSCIRNGQFIYAHRESNKLLSEINRKEYDLSEDVSGLLVASIKRTTLFLKLFIEIYSQNQKSLDIAKRV